MIEAMNEFRRQRERWLDEKDKLLERCSTLAAALRDCTHMSFMDAVKKHAMKRIETLEQERNELLAALRVASGWALNAQQNHANDGLAEDAETVRREAEEIDALLARHKEAK